MTRSKLSSGNGIASASPDTVFAVAVGGASPVSAIAANVAATVDSSLCVTIERNDVCASSVRLECMTAAAAADVEHAVPWADGEPAEIDGQQDWLLPAIRVGSGRVAAASPIRFADAPAAIPIASS